MAEENKTDSAAAQSPKRNDSKNTVNPVEKTGAAEAEGAEGNEPSASEKQKGNTINYSSQLGNTSKSPDFEMNFELLAVYEEFTWPENRKETESYIAQLKRNNILFIRGINSHWWHKAPERFAAVLQVSGIRLWPECKGVFQSKALNEENLTIGFWNKYERSEKARVVHITAGAGEEYLKAFIKPDQRQIYFRYIAPLKNKNIFLIIHVEDTDNSEALFNNVELEDNSEHLLSTWNVDSPKLELIKKGISDNDVLLKKINEEVGISARNSEIIYNYIRSNKTISITEIIEKIYQVSKAVFNEDKLLDDCFAQEKELNLRVLFTCSFFSNTSPGDFDLIMALLLKDQYINVKNNNFDKKKKLSELWEKPMERHRVFRDCSIGIRFFESESRVTFNDDINAGRMQKHFLSAQNYGVFYFFACQILESNIIFDLSISPILRNYLTEFYLTTIKSNPSTFNEKWLIKKTIEKIIAKKRTAEENITLLENKEQNFDKSSLKPLVGLLKAMLISDVRVLVDFVKKYFDSFMKVFENPKLALELSIDLYNELQNHPNFPEEQLDDYFKKNLDIASTEEAIDIYMIFRKNFEPDLFLKKTNNWINNSDISPDSFVKIIAWTYKIDYCIDSLHAYQENKSEEKIYKFLDFENYDPLTSGLTDMLTKITSTACVSSLTQLIQNDVESVVRFLTLEWIMTSIELPFGRPLINHLKPHLLAAEIIFNWFAILTTQTAREQYESQDKISIFIKAAKEHIESSVLEKYLKYWRSKIAFFYNEYIIFYKDKRIYDGEYDTIHFQEQELILKRLKERRDTLESFIKLISI